METEAREFDDGRKWTQVQTDVMIHYPVTTGNGWQQGQMKSIDGVEKNIYIHTHCYYIIYIYIYIYYLKKNICAFESCIYKCFLVSL